MAQVVQRRLRLAVDIAMTVALPLLMAYSLVGEAFHEVLGTVMLVLFVVHHVLNRRWYGVLTKGHHTPQRVFQTVLDAALLVCMVGQPLSGILISKYLYTFVQVRGAAVWARELHLCLAYWSFVLMSVHAGAHLAAPLRKLRKKSRTAWHVFAVVALLVSCWGLYQFVARDVAGYLTLRVAFAFMDYVQPLPLFLLDYLAMMVLFGTIGIAVSVGLGRLSSSARRGA